MLFDTTLTTSIDRNAKMARDKLDPRDHHLWKSPGGMLYVKIAIPPEVRDRFPRSETGKVKDRITESLGTDSFMQARILRDQRLAHWQRAFARLATGAALTPEEMVTERQRVHRSTLHALLATPVTTFEDKQLDKMWVASHSIQAQQTSILVAEVTAEVRTIADEKYGVGIITEGSETWMEIWRLVARAKAKAFEDRLVVLFRSRNALNEFPSEPAMETGARSATGSEPHLPNNGNGGNLERFSVATEHYLTWLATNRKARPATVAEYKSKAECFTKFAKDPPIGAVTIEQAQDFLNEVAKDTKAATVNTYHFVCRAVFEHARTERHKFSGDNPFSFQRRKAEAKSKAKFTIDELNQLFNSPTFTERETKPKTYGVASALPWATLIALYSGAGLEEVAQLRPKDIRQENGNGWMIHVEPEAALSGALKRTARKRIIPLHPELQRLGLLQYLDALPRGAERLFPGLPVPANGKDKLGGALGKAFGRWRVKLGIKREGEQLDFHSLRHNFTNTLENIGTSQSDAARLAGHKVKGVTFGVYSAPELKRLAGIVERIKYDGLKIA
jgi:integrase